MDEQITLTLTKEEAQILDVALTSVQIGGTVQNADNIVQAIQRIQNLRAKLAAAVNGTSDEG